MRLKYFVPIATICITLMIGFFPQQSSSQSNNNEIGLTEEEIEWIKEHPTLRLAPDPDFPPLEYFDKGNGYSGIAADFIRLLEKKITPKI